jgi:hypothetical protein
MKMNKTNNVNKSIKRYYIYIGLNCVGIYDTNDENDVFLCCQRMAHKNKIKYTYSECL